MYIYGLFRSGSVKRNKMIKAFLKVLNNGEVIIWLYLSEGALPSPAPWFTINCNNVNLTHSRGLLCKRANAEKYIFIMTVNPRNEQRESQVICIISELYGAPVKGDVCFVLPPWHLPNIKLQSCAYTLYPYCSARGRSRRAGGQWRLGLSYRCFLWVRSTIDRH